MSDSKIDPKTDTIFSTVTDQTR